MHELSLAAGRDHVEFLIDAVNRDVPELAPKDKNVNFSPARASDVIKLCAEKAGWGKTLPKGSGLGLAWCYSHAGHVAQAVELSVDANKRIKIASHRGGARCRPDHRHGRAPKPRRRARRSTRFSTAMGLQINIEKGRIQQQNYNDYPILRMPFAPMTDRGLFHPVGFSAHRHGRTRLPGAGARARQRHLRRHRRAGTFFAAPQFGLLGLRVNYARRSREVGRLTYSATASAMIALPCCVCKYQSVKRKT